MEVDKSFHGNTWSNGIFHASSGSFHCWWKWKLPLFPSMGASTTIFGGSFHELPRYSILSDRLPPNSNHFHEFRKLPVVSIWLRVHRLPYKLPRASMHLCRHSLTSINFHKFLNLQQLLYRSTDLYRLPSTSINFHERVSIYFFQIRLPPTSNAFHVFPHMDFHCLPSIFTSYHISST